MGVRKGNSFCFAGTTTNSPVTSSIRLPDMHVQLRQSACLRARAGCSRCEQRNHPERIWVTQCCTRQGGPGVSGSAAAPALAMPFW